jgi:hypothetical protein
MQKNTPSAGLVKALGDAGFAVEKAHSVAHHLMKMAKCVGSHCAKGMDMHKAHHAEMMKALDGGNIAACKSLAEGHLNKGMGHHEDHQDLMQTHMDKLHKILGTEEASSGWDGSNDTAEHAGGIPAGATQSHYALKSAGSVDIAEEIQKGIQSAMGEFFKAISAGATESFNAEATVEKAAGIGDRRQIQWPQSGQNNGAGVTKAADNGAGAGEVVKKAASVIQIDAETVHKAAGGDVEALEKMGFGKPGSNVPDSVRAAMAKRA